MMNYQSIDTFFGDTRVATTCEQKLSPSKLLMIKDLFIENIVKKLQLHPEDLNSLRELFDMNFEEYKGWSEKHDVCDMSCSSTTCEIVTRIMSSVYTMIQANLIVFENGYSLPVYGIENIIRDLERNCNMLYVVTIMFKVLTKEFGKHTCAILKLGHCYYKIQTHTGSYDLRELERSVTSTTGEDVVKELYDIGSSSVPKRRGIIGMMNPDVKKHNAKLFQCYCKFVGLTNPINSSTKKECYAAPFMVERYRLSNM
jgi:hypothetical protein